LTQTISTHQSNVSSARRRNSHSEYKTMSFFTKTSHNPIGVCIQFTEHDHRYWVTLPLKDELGKSVEITYISATTFLKHYAKPFDAAAQAKISGERKGIAPEQLIRDWEYARDQAANFGTRTHAIAEDCINGKQPRFQPENPKERATFSQAWQGATYFRSNFQVIGAEIIVFHTDLRIAGTIDLCVLDPASGTYWILDWKTNKAINTTSKYGDKMLKPIQHLDDCELTKYALQLSLYEFILRSQRYIPINAPVRRAIIHLTETAWTAIETADLAREVADLVVYEANTPPF
jgi:hypothetical protein